MPLLFVILSVAAVVAMGAGKAVSKTPPMLPPQGPLPVQMQVGEIWGVEGTIDRDMTDAAWQAFHDALSGIMTGLGGRIGKLVSNGRSFAFQIQPTSRPVSIQVPLVDPPFTLTSAKKLSGVTQVSGRFS